MFSDGFDLRKWVGAAFPHRIFENFDMSLKQEALSGDASSDVQKMDQCLSAKCSDDVHGREPTKASTDLFGRRRAAAYLERNGI
ncbi:hypothetical protein DKX38_019384 [Salix brachista]|uniref:Uncharacterized protein n=1 Tax=Salix brachista TaxID=2182728 RepID=A0A5N5KG36_9ROSI|nr:hypothetical protein DKX38_019384 [Salix brachista]